KLYAVRGSASLAGAAWPMFRRNIRRTAKYFPSPTVLPVLTSGHVFQFILSGMPGQYYEVTTSTDLRNWHPFVSLFGAPGLTNLIDPAWAEEPVHFFRVWSR